VKQRRFLLCTGESRAAELKSLLSAHSEITIARDWLSALEYLAIEQFEALFLSWKQVIRQARDAFKRRLGKLAPRMPVVLLIDGDVLDAGLFSMEEHLFAVMRPELLPERLPDILERLDRYFELLEMLPENEIKDLRPSGFGPFIGNNHKMLDIYQQILKVAPTDFTVLILGPSGSGKELVARTIHALSPRRKKAFISINCAAIPETLLESELFGAEKGAYTGADRSRPGKVELADKGSLFLDEIGDMPLGLQAKLLRVLEEKIVERLGSRTATKVDFRLLTATNKNLEKLVHQNKFRRDLYYRLNVVPIRLTEVRHRGDDITLLTIHLLNKLIKQAPHLSKNISWSFLEELKKTPLSGNVRELENWLTRLLLQWTQPTLSSRALSSLEFAAPNAGLEETSILSDGSVKPLREVEKEAIQAALRSFKGNISRTAQALEISRTALYRKIKRYGLEHESQDSGGTQDDQSIID